MNDEQYKRFRKMQAEDIKCLYITHDKKKNIYFLVSGSTGSHYKVSLLANGKISCSCPDFSHGAKEQECVCKHCLYVIYKVLKFVKDVDHTFFKRCYFTPDEVHTIHTIYREHLRKKKRKSTGT